MNERLHVTHVVLSLDVGGLERNVVNQLRERDKLGQRVSIICLERPGTLAPTAEALGARVVCLDKRPGLRPALVARMRAALRDLRPDVVHTHQIGPLFYTGLATVGLGVPLVVHTEHGKVNYAGRRRTRWLGRLAAWFTHRFYCLSEDMARTVAAQGVVPPWKLRVIQNGIVTDDYARPHDTTAVRRSLGIPDGVPVVGTVGRLDEIKRQDVLLGAFARLRRRMPDVHLMLVGDGPRRAELLHRVTQLDLGGCVHFAGYQVWTPPYLQTMTCFALPSRSEGMPQSVLEACVAGVPVIASRVGGLPEVIEHERTGLLVSVGDEEALTAGLLALLTRPAWARELAEAARAAVTDRFDIRRMAREYHQDFLELLGRTPSPVAG